MNEFLSAVNQKQLYATLLLQQAEAVQGQRHLQQALLEASVCHLYQAYRFYLGEIAATYQCLAAPEVTSPKSLVALLEAIDKNPIEASEILSLSTSDKSWLSRFLSCYASLGLITITAVGAVDSQLISAVSMDHEDWSLLAPDIVNGWITDFSELVERQRDMMLEC